MCGSLLSTLSHQQTSKAFHESLTTFDGVANCVSLHLNKSFRSLFTISQISVISAKISRTTMAAQVRTFPIDVQ